MFAALPNLSILDTSPAGLQSNAITSRWTYLIFWNDAIVMDLGAGVLHSKCWSRLTGDIENGDDHQRISNPGKGSHWGVMSCPSPRCSIFYSQTLDIVQVE